MVDLQTQYQHIKDDIDRGIQAVIDSASFIKGPAVSTFQANLEQYTGAKHVIPVGNGTDALQIALMALGLQPGDEVITPTVHVYCNCRSGSTIGIETRSSRCGLGYDEYIRRCSAQSYHP